MFEGRLTAALKQKRVTRIRRPSKGFDGLLCETFYTVQQRTSVVRFCIGWRPDRHRVGNAGDAKLPLPNSSDQDGRIQHQLCRTGKGTTIFGRLEPGCGLPICRHLKREFCATRFSADEIHQRVQVADHSTVSCQERFPSVAYGVVLSRKVEAIPNYELSGGAIDLPDWVFGFADPYCATARFGGEILYVSPVAVVIFGMGGHRYAHRPRGGDELHLDVITREILRVNPYFVRDRRGT